MATPFSSLDEVLNSLRKLIGGVADDPSIARVVGVMEAGKPIDDYPAMPWLDRAFRGKLNPPAGTGVAVVHPDRLLASRHGDPERALASLLSSDYQAFRGGVQEPYLPVYLQPTDTIGKSDAVYVSPARARPEPSHPVPEVGLVLAPSEHDKLTRMLIHEIRHATTKPDVLDKMASRALTNVDVPWMRNMFVHGGRGKRPYQSYLSKPAEQISFLGEAADDFRATVGRPLTSEHDAEQALNMMVEGNQHILPDAGRAFYREAFRRSPAARDMIMGKLRKVIGVAPLVMAGEGE